MIDTRTFNYSFTQRDSEGVLRASSDLFYGPWDSREEALSSIKNALGVTDASVLPDGAKVAIWDNAQHTSLVEYILSHGILINNKSVGITSYTKTVYAYYLGETDNAPMFGSGSISKMKNDLSKGHWYLSIPKEYDPETNILTVSFATFLVSQDTYTRINDDHTAYEGDPSWDNLFRIGGGVGSSTLVSDKVFRFDITNDNAIIPTNGGIVTKEALKQASKSILTVYLNGKKQNSEDITQLALQTMDEFPFEVKYEVSDDSNHFLYYWLEPLNGADSVTLLPGSMYMLPITISIAGDTASGILIQRIHISQGTSKYNLICSPNIINVTKTYEFPSLSFIAQKITWDGFQTTESQQEDFSIELSLVGEDQDENYIFTSNNSALVIDDTQYRSLLINKTSHDTLKVILKVDGNIEDTEYLPIFFQSNLVGSANRDLTIDIINENCLVGESLVGKTDTDSQNALKILTQGSLNIMYQGKPLSSDYYSLKTVEDVIQSDSNSNIYEKDPNHDNVFYMTKLMHSSSAAITFEYVNPALGKTLSEADNSEKNQLTYFQSVNIVNNGADAEFYRFNTFPAVIWSDDNGFVPDTLEVYAYKVKGSTVTRLGGNDNVSLDGYKYRIEYGLQDSPADPIPFSNNNNQIPLDASNKNVDHIAIYYYDSQNNELDREYFDINRYPKDGTNGTSNYIIYTNNPVIVIDDDSSAETIQQRSLSDFSLYYGGSKVTDFVNYELDTTNSVLYNENHNKVDFDTIFKKGNGNCLTLQKNIENLNDHYYTGNIVWNAKIGNDNKIVASICQALKVYDISNGETYFLNISPNILYFDQYGVLKEDKPSTLRFTVSKLQDGNVDYIKFSNTTYIQLNDSNPNHEAITITQSGDTYSEIDFSHQNYASLEFPVTVLLYVNGSHLLSQTINQVIQGDAAVSVDSGYTLNIDNDLIRIDDQTIESDLNAISVTNITVLHEGVEVDIADIDPDYQLTVTVNDTLNGKINTSTITDNSYYLAWDGSQINKKIHDQLSGRVIITLEFNDGQNPIKIQKTQTVQVLDFSQGEVYRMKVTPNYVAKSVDDVITPERVECSISKTYKGTTTEAKILGVNRDVSLQIDLYTYTQEDNVTNSHRYATFKTTDSEADSWCAESGNKAILFLDMLKGDIIDLNRYNIVPDFIEIKAIKNNIVVDSETIQYVKEAQDGVDGNSIEYVYLQKDSIDNNLQIDNENDYGYYYDESNNPVLITLADAHTISEVIPIIGEAQEYQAFIGWSDEPKGVSEDHPYEYMSKRTYDGKTQRWSDFSQPILWAKYGLNGKKGDKGDDAVSPYMLSINNDTVIIDDNANDNTIKTASLTTVKLYQGVNEITDAVIEASENNQKFNCIQENGKWYLVKQQTGNIDLGTYPIEYIAKIGNIPIASAIQSVKVVDVTEDGCSFKLELSNDVLYRENADEGVSSEEKITIRLQKITGEASASEYLDLTEDSEYRIKVNKEYKNAAKATSIDKDANTNVIIDTNTYTKSQGNIIVEAYKKIDEQNSILLDRETISFAVRGERGPQGDPGQPGNPGSPGLNGCMIIHHYQSEGHPKVGYIYHNDSTLDSQTRYIDVIILDEESVQDEGDAATRYPVLICQTTHEYVSDDKAQDTSSNPQKWHTIWRYNDELRYSAYWSAADVNEGYAFFNYVSALNARIENLVAQHASVEELAIYENIDNQSTLKGKFTSKIDDNINDNKPLWLGGTTGQNAKFWVDKDGNASFGGSLTTSGDVNLGGDLTVDGNGTFSGELTFSNAKSKFEGTSIAKEVEVKLSELTQIKNTANYYINPLDYGVNVVIINDIDPTNNLYQEEINIYIDIPSYELSSLLPDSQDPNKESKITTNVSDGYKYIRYCNTFIEQKLRLVCESVYSQGQASKEANVYYRGLLSHYNKSTETTSECNLLTLLNSSLGDDSYASCSINKFNKASSSNDKYKWRVPTYQNGESVAGSNNASYPKFHTETVKSANVEFILGCHKYNIEGKEYVVWLSEMHQQLGDYMNYEIENTIDKERLITRDIYS